MQSLGWLRQHVVDWIEDSSDFQTIDRAINRSIAKVVGRCVFSQLMSKVTVTPDENGIILVPPRCDRVLEVYPSSTLSNETEFVFGGSRKVQGLIRRTGYKKRGVGAIKTPLAEVTMSFQNGASIAEEVSGSVLSASHVGHELVIKGGNEKYEITSFDNSGTNPQIGIYPDYRFGTVTSINCLIRRIGIEQIALYDSNGNAYTGDVTIEYVEMHPYLVSNDDMLMIPTPETVGLDAVRFMLRQTKYDVDSERLEADYISAKRSEYSKQVSNTDESSVNIDPVFRIHNRRGRGCQRVQPRWGN